MVMLNYLLQKSNLRVMIDTNISMTAKTRLCIYKLHNIRIIRKSLNFIEVINSSHYFIMLLLYSLDKSIRLSNKTV